MPLMTKIRESLATFFSVFAGLFVIYIVLDWGMDITGRRHSTRAAEAQEVGKINGEAVTYKEFSDIVRQASDNQKNQSGTEPDENQLRMIRDQIWNQLVEQHLYDAESKRLNVRVSDQEIIDWVKGDSPPDFLKQQFTDSTGTFDRQRYEATIMDPRNKNIMLNVEDFLRRQRQKEKLQSLLFASVLVPEDEIRQRFVDQNTKFEADYALFDLQLVKDDDVKVSDDELRRYYNDHSDEFKVEATRKMKYVNFPEQPSRDDSTSVTADMEDVARRARSGSDFAELAKTYSEAPPTETYYKHGELAQEREEAVFSAKAGDILGPLNESDGYHVMKVLDFRDGKDEFVRASHILINIQNNDSVAALKEARDVTARAKRGEDFASLAKQFSKDPGSAIRGGDLGWFGKGRMVKQFEDAAFRAKPGQIVGPVRSPFGYHIIKLVAKDNREVKLTDIRMSIHVSQQTKNDLQQKAQDFAYLAKQGDFTREAQQSKYTVAETPPFQKGAVIPGVGVSPAASKFAFGSKLGEVSEAMSMQNGYAVFMISEIKEAGIRPFEEVKNSIDGRLKRERKMEKVKAMAADIRKTLSPGDSLGTIHARTPNVSVQHLAQFTLGGAIPGIGRDLMFIGGVSSLSVGEISQPIEGARGAYLVKVTSRTPFDSVAFNSQKDALRSQLLSEKRNRFFSEWSDQLKKSAEIVDNRDQFYR